MLSRESNGLRGMTQEKLIADMDAKLHFPGLSNTWTMPIENRLDMELTGIKTPVGIKIQGPNLEGIQELGGRMQQILGALPEMRSIFAERVAEGFYINIEVNRAEAARYGLTTVGDIQRVITSGIGGENIAENVEGRERYPISVRYAADFRDNLDKLRQVLVSTPSNGQVPLGNVAKVSFSRGPSMIRDEDGALTGYVYFDLNTKDYGGLVERADRFSSRQTGAASGLQLQMVRRVRIRAARQRTAEDHSAGRSFLHLHVALYGEVFHSVAGSDSADLSNHLRHVRRTAVAVVAGRYNFSVAVYRLHRAVRNRGGDRRR